MTLKIDKTSKVVIIGAGSVGATIAYTLALKMLVEEIVLVDANKDKAIGEVMDLKHGQAYYESLNISAGDFSDCENADYIIITAGAKQDPGETRLQLTDRNIKILENILDKTTKFNRHAFYILISNPVDILTQHAIKYAGLDTKQVFGTGTALDTSRFKYLLGQEFNISPSNIHAYIMGEHGDTSLPILSHANIAGIPLMEYPEYTKDRVQEIYEDTKNAAYEVIKKKGATYYAIALVTAEIIRSIEYDQKKIIPVSAHLNGEYGYEDVCFGVPCVIGKNGIEKIVELNISEEEKKQLKICVQKLKSFL